MRVTMNDSNHHNVGPTIRHHIFETCLGLRVFMAGAELFLLLFQILYLF